MHGGKNNQLNKWYISQAGKEDTFERDTTIPELFMQILEFKTENSNMKTK